MARSTASPTGWENRSLTDLKMVNVDHGQNESGPRRQQVEEGDIEAAAVRQAGERVFQACAGQPFGFARQQLIAGSKVGGAQLRFRGGGAQLVRLALQGIDAGASLCRL